MLVRARLPLLLVAGLMLVPAVPVIHAQIHGVPASVTSIGFGGSNSFAPAASVTSLGPNGFGEGHARFQNCCFNPFFQTGPVSPGFGQGHHSRRDFFVSAVPVYVPYTQVVVVQPEVAQDRDDQEAYAGEPVILERRLTRTTRTRTVAVDEQPAPAASTPVAAEPAAPVVPQPSTLLIFRDGHQAELQNYAIVGETIFDLTDNRAHKIQLADIDVPATRTANEARGVDFQVPVNPAR